MSCFACCFGLIDDPMENNQQVGFFRNLFSKITVLFRNHESLPNLDTEEPKVVTKFVEEDHPYNIQKETDFDEEYDNACPTCFEEYTPENPKVITKCYHHYHLGCIYEWMERSALCPICDREMEFEESK